MTFPSTWTSVTGSGRYPFDTFEEIGAILLYLPNDSVKQPFFGGAEPFQVYRPGVVGFGLDPDVGFGIDPLPDGASPHVEVWAVHFLRWQYEAWQIANLTINSGSCFWWQMQVGITLDYLILPP